MFYVLFSWRWLINVWQQSEILLKFIWLEYQRGESGRKPDDSEHRCLFRFRWLFRLSDGLRVTIMISNLIQLQHISKQRLFSFWQHQTAWDQLCPWLCHMVPMWLVSPLVSLSICIFIYKIEKLLYYIWTHKEAV